MQKTIPLWKVSPASGSKSGGSCAPFTPSLRIFPQAEASKLQCNTSHTPAHISGVIMALGAASNSMWLIWTETSQRMLLKLSTIKPSHSLCGAASPCMQKGIGPSCFQLPKEARKSLQLFSLGFFKVCCGQMFSSSWRPAPYPSQHPQGLPPTYVVGE